jgi:hypothetical protein
MQVHSGSRGVSLLIHSPDTRLGQWVNARSRTLFLQKEHPVLIVEEAERRRGLRDSLEGYRDRSPDNPARGDSLYLLRYSGNRPMA